jgi:urea ABC transporter permease protein UrtB
MSGFNGIVGFLYQFGDAAAFLILCASGLAIIFGMMGVINLAHGEFIMAGAYATVTVERLGVPLPLAIICGALFSGVLGVLLERLVIRHLYGRPLDTIVATWGISLIASQGTLILLGPGLSGVSTPLGSVQIGDLSYSVYRFVLMGAAAAILAGLYLLFNFTRFGLLARATIQVPRMAESLGVNTRLIYSLTFGIGAALAGATGGLYAPTMTMVPTMGSQFIMEAFVTVVVGGNDVFLGTAPAGVILGLVKAAMTTWEGQLAGQIGLLVSVIIVIRILPRGVSGLILRERA